MHLESALRLDPTLRAAQMNLGVGLAKIPGRSAEAVARSEAMLHASPDDAEASGRRTRPRDQSCS